MNAGDITANLRLKTQEFTAGMKEAGSMVGQFQSELNRVSGDFKKVGGGALAMGTATAVGIGSAVKTAADFEKGMSRVGALSGATEKELAMMTEEAMRLGSTTSFSATQASEGFQKLAMAGFSAEDSTASLGAVLNMAAAGQIELGTAADIASNMMSAFGIEAKNASNVSDVLTKTFTSSNTTLEGLGNTMKYVAPVAASVGWTIEDMAAAAGKMGDAGIDSSQAGTMLRGAITRLIKPTGEAAGIMEEYGIEVENADGTMKSLPDILENMNESFSDLTDTQKAAAMATIFGQEAVSGMLTLMDDPAGLRNFTKELENAGGTAEKIAAEQLDNLSGSLIEFFSALEGAQIIIGNVFIPILTALVDVLTAVLTWFNELPSSIQTAVAVFSALASIGLVVGGAFLLLIGFLPAIISGFASVATVAAALWSALTTVAGAFAFLATPIGATIAGAAALTAGIVYLINRFNLLEVAMSAVKVGVDWIKEAFLSLGEQIGVVKDGTFSLQSVMALLESVFVRIGEQVTVLWNKFQDTAVFEVLISIIQSVIGYFREFGEAIMTAINKGDFTPLLEKVATLIPSLIAILIGGIPGLIIAGVNLINSIANGMGISVPQLIEMATSMIVQFIQRIIEMIPQLLETGMQILMSIIQGISTALPFILEAVVQIITTLIEAFTTYLPMILQIGLQLLMSIINGILQNLPMLISVAAQLITMLVETIVTYLPALLQMGIQILMTLIDGIIQMLPQLITMALQLITTLVTALLEALPQIIQAGIQILMALIDGILSILPQLISTAIDLIVQIVNALIGALPQIIEAGIQILMALIDGIIQMLPMLISAALDLIIAIVDALIGALPQIISAGVEILLALIDGIIQMLPALISAALDLIIAIVDALISALPQIIDAGVEILLALIDGLIQTIPTLVGAVPEIVDALWNAFTDVDWGGVGMEIINGIAAGIENFAGTLISKGREVASNALGGIKDFLGIASPSKVMRDQVGGEMMNGIMVGIDKLKRKPLQAVNKVAAGLVDGTDIVKNSMKDIANMNVNPNIGNVRPSVAGFEGFDNPNDDGGYGDGNAPLINVEHMETRDDQDVRNVSRELYNLQRNHDRSKGGR